MPNYDALLTNFAVGDDIDIVRTITNIPVGQLLTSARFTVKHLNSTCPVLFAVSGVIESNTVTFHLTGSETMLLPDGFPARYWIEVETNAEKTYTPEHGRIIAFAGARCA